MIVIVRSPVVRHPVRRGVPILLLFLGLLLGFLLSESLLLLRWVLSDNLRQYRLLLRLIIFDVDHRSIRPIFNIENFALSEAIMLRLIDYANLPLAAAITSQLPLTAREVVLLGNILLAPPLLLAGSSFELKTTASCMARWRLCNAPLVLTLKQRFHILNYLFAS